MRSFLLGAPVEGSFNIPFRVEKDVPPSMPDRLEFDVDGSISPTYTNFGIILPTIVTSLGSGVANKFSGEEYSFTVTSTGSKPGWASLTGYGETIPSGSSFTRYAEFSGLLDLNLSYVLFTATSASLITRLIIPTWCGVSSASASKIFVNCSDVYFVGRTYEQAVAMHSLMTTVFPNAIWHCTDGDFHPDGTRI